jgi:hypothetical protein
MDLDDQTFRRLLEVTDPVGVLTITTGFVPGTTDDQASRIELQNQLRTTQSDLESRHPERARALERTLSALGSDLDGLLSPRSSGRGRALIVPLSDGERHHVNVQVPFEHRVVVADRAFVRPFVAAIDEGRPAGIVVGTRSGARVLEWSLAGVRELASLDFELTDAQLADSKGGPVASNPARGQTTTSHREAFEDRVEGNRHRFLKDVASTVAGVTHDRRWDRIVVAGSDRIREELVGLLEDPRIEVVVTEDASWEDLSEGRLAQEAWPVLRSLHRRREQGLVGHVQESARAGGHAVLGPRRVCEAANIGRVAHLLFTSDAQVSGYVAEDGSLHADAGGHAAQAGVELTREPYLVEQLVERVLRMGGQVTRIDGEETSAVLASNDGVAARLRW